MTKTLIKNATILSVDPAIGDLQNGDILIAGDLIKEIGVGLDATDADVIDGTGMIAIPGLINAHIHTWQTGLRGIAGGWTSKDYHANIHRKIAMSYTAEAMYLGNLIGALGQISAGSTTIFDWCHGNKTPDHTDGAIDGLVESGIRAVFGHGTVKPEKRDGERHFSEIPHPRAEIERLRKGRLAGDDGLVTLAMAILGPENSTSDVTLHDFKLAREFGLLSSSHTWNREDRISKEGFYPIAEAGLLGPDHNIVHGNYLIDDELKMLLDHGVSVTVTPTCEVKSSTGDPLTGRIKALGAKPSIGSDTEVFVAADMFHTMRFTLQYQQSIDCKEQSAGNMPIDKLATTPREALEWATIEGARALQMEDKIGSLTPGKKADIVLLDATDVCLTPINDPVNAVVQFADRSNVDTVLIGGEVVKSAGKLIFPKNIMAAKQAALGDEIQRIFDAAGYRHQAA